MCMGCVRGVCRWAHGVVKHVSSCETIATVSPRAPRPLSPEQNAAASEYNLRKANIEAHDAQLLAAQAKYYKLQTSELEESVYRFRTGCVPLHASLGAVCWCFR